MREVCEDTDPGPECIDEKVSEDKDPGTQAAISTSLFVYRHKRSQQVVDCLSYIFRGMCGTTLSVTLMSFDDRYLISKYFVSVDKLLI
jgi:hypothetical protein